MGFFDPEGLLDGARALLHGPGVLVVHLLRPVKLFAWRRPPGFLRRVILGFTTFVDWGLIFVFTQNQTMLVHQRVYGGNFLFGEGVMKVDHAVMRREIELDAMRGHNFMGVGIVANSPDVFATNAGILNQCPPYRNAARHHLDQAVFTQEVRDYTLEQVKQRSATILADWAAHPDMTNFAVLRSVVTRIFLELLAGVTISEREAEAITGVYLRRFVESSLFYRYFGPVLTLLGTRRAIRAGAYLPLTNLGIDRSVVDITLFAAMFSVGTHVMQCATAVRERSLPYGTFDFHAKVRMVTEVLRLQPTVTSVHRIVETDELVEVCGQEILLTGGDEVVYPFVCAHLDPEVFPRPMVVDVERPDACYDAVLSWSKGPHACPAKDLSILVVIAMLDTLAEHRDLSRLHLFNPMF